MPGMDGPYNARSRRHDLFETPNGGAVCRPARSPMLAAWGTTTMPTTSRSDGDVLRRFLDPTPFAMPK